MLIKGLFLATAGTLIAGAASAQPQVLSLQQLQAKCHEMEANEQVLPFTSQFTCSEERTFWVKKGSKPLPLANCSEIKVKALIKGNQHQTDWWSIPGRSQDQATSCDMFEQVRGIARAAKTIKSCAELDQILAEQEYCKGLLMPVWDDCARDMANGNIREGHQGNCEYIPTGVVRGCAVAAPDTTTSSSTSVSDTSTSSTTVKIKVKEPSVDSSSSSSSSDAPAPLPTDSCPVGAGVKVVKVKNGMFKHSMVQLENDPAPGSLLAKLNLQKGDIIAKVDDKKVQSSEELEKALRAAKKAGSVKIKFQDSRKIFLERVRPEF